MPLVKLDACPTPLSLELRAGEPVFALPSMGYTRFLMSASALVLALLGLLGSFMPEQVLDGMSAPASPILMLLIQVLGALYLGFAGLNWMVRDSLVGGIYSRPVVIGNLLHFLTAGLAMIKLLVRAPELQMLWPLALAYAVFAATFGIVLFRHPVRKSSMPAT